MNRTMQSPRRPIILKRRKLPFHKNEGDRLQNQSAHAPGTPTLPDGICIMNHPAMTDTQVVVIPKREDFQSVIGVLTAKGKERGSQGPNKFILLSGSNGSGNGVKPASLATSDSKNNLGPKACADGNTTPLLTGRLRNYPDRSLLDNSLTNIQWLGRMDTDVDGVQPPQNDSNKENINDNAQLQKPQQAEEEVSSVKGSLSERPPYSYMAMIQFAINSKKNKMMTLKEIYNWIEDHFPYFRNVAKPGWKNSIRHNLSLHDLFIRESTSDGKISYWTIKPESNRCLTLDQVYKPIVDPATLSCTPQTKQVCVQQQQKRVPTEQKKVTSALPERKMKPLLPRTDSYLVPIQLPLAPSLFSAALTLPNPHQSSIASNPVSKTGCKRLCIAPKIMKTDSSSIVKLTSVPEMKEESLCMPITAESCSTKSKARSSSRRKQRLLPPSTEEPVLLYADTTSFDSGVASDISVFQEVEIKTESWHGPQLETEPFKTPIKGSHPASSTPSKVLEPWMITPLGEGSHSVLDFSPIRTPQRHENTCLSFSGTPFKDLPLFSSPCDLLTSCSHEAQTNPANRSLTEGLVLDTMNDSLSKILVDISFSCLEDDDLGIANLSWSQFIPELK